MENVSDNPKITFLSSKAKEVIQDTIDYLADIDDETGEIPEIVVELKKLVK